MAAFIGSILINRLRTPFTRSVRSVYKHPELFPSLQERLAAEDLVDPEVSALVDIGLQSYPISGRTAKPTKVSKEDKQSLIDAAISRTLLVDTEKVKQEWEKEELPNAVHLAATHYGVYTDLFRHGYFIPRVPLHITYRYNESEVNPVHRGNILLAKEASTAPEVSFDSDPNDMWTLILTNPDGHLNDSETEYVHWFIANIKGGDVTTGEEIVPYLQPFPLRGTGYHRMVFVLYKQDKGLVNYEYPKKVNHRYKLKERTFKTFDFYKANQDVITPAGLGFFQAVWNSTLTDFFHNVLEMREPVYEYDQKPKELPPQVIYPKMKSFNRYLDRYRDPKEMREEVLLKRLKTLDPFKEEPPMPKYPNLHIDTSLPTWMLANVWKENNRIGRFRDLRPHSIYEQAEFDFFKDMLNTKAGESEPPSEKK